MLSSYKSTIWRVNLHQITAQIYKIKAKKEHRFHRMNKTKEQIRQKSYWERVLFSDKKNSI